MKRLLSILVSLLMVAGLTAPALASGQHHHRHRYAHSFDRVLFRDHHHHHKHKHKHRDGRRSTSNVDVPPNIVFILTDDLSMNLLQYMPNVQGLEDQGMTFTNATVTDSLCCPSRASIFTGEFPHNTGVTSNGGANGGYEGFSGHNDEQNSFSVTLRNFGYLTWFAGKYFNAYQPCADPAVGWTDPNMINDGGYNEWGYNIGGGGHCHWVGGDDPNASDYNSPSEYGTYYMRAQLNSFIRDNDSPFFAELATFAPHFPYTPAPEDEDAYPNLNAPRAPPYNQQVVDGPQWTQKPPLSDDLVERSDYDFRQRVRSVLSVDGAIGNIENVLKNQGKWDNTYFVFASDNGFHTGEYRLAPGKMTAFDTDVHVPLIVTGPGICHGCTNDNMVSNIDLAPTFEELSGAQIHTTTIDGHSLVPLLHGEDVPWRTFVGIEHTNPNDNDCSPDCQGPASGALPSYRAIRAATFTYVEDATGEREYYDRSTDPNELHNIYDTLSDSRKDALHVRVQALSTCQGYTECWKQAVVQ